MSIERSIGIGRPPKVVNRDARNTQRAIYEAAVRLIYERGYHGMTFRALAAEVGLQMASLYYYFASKQDLLMQIMLRTMRDLQATVESAIAGIDDPVDELEAAIRAHVLFHANRSMEAFITDSELRALEPANRQIIVKLRDDYEAIFEGILQKGVRSGAFEVPDLKLALYGVMAMCTGVAVWFRPEGRLSLEEIAEAYSQLFLTGVIASSRRLSRERASRR